MVEIDFDALKERLKEEDAEVEEVDLNDALEMAEEITNTELRGDAQEDAAELGAAPVEPLKRDEDVPLSEEF